MISNEDIRNLYIKKGNNQRELYRINNSLSEAQAKLKKTKVDIINSTDKKTLGTNDKERDAYIALHTNEEQKKVEEAEAERRRLELESSLIRDKIECFQWQIRNEQVEHFRVASPPCWES